MRKTRKTLLATCCTIASLCFAAGIGLSVQTVAYAETVAPTVTFKEGASVRLHSTSYGIRFISVIKNYNADYAYGMYIFPEDYLDDYTSGSIVAHAQSKLADGKTLAGGDCDVYLNGTTYQMNGALTGLKYNNLNREWVAIAYTRDTNGNVTYSELSDSRNIVWVSGAALDDETKQYTEAQTDILDDFIKLGYHQAVGTDESTAKSTSELPAISVSGETTVYNGLWTDLTPTFTYNGEEIVEPFNPYVSDISDEKLTYQQENVRSGFAGVYTLGYENITGNYTVNVRAFDETLNSEYFGVYETVTQDTAIANGRNALVINGSQEADVMLIKGENARKFLANTDYSVTAMGLSFAGAKIDYYGGPSDLVVCEEDHATVYRVAHIDNFFDPTVTMSKTYLTTNLGRNTSNTGDRVALIPKYDGNMTARYCTWGMDIEYLKLAAAEGYYAVEFDVQVDDAYAAYANKGLRVYASQKTGNTVDGGAIQTGTAGVSLYGDFGTHVTEATTFTVKIVLKDFLALDENAQQLRFVVSGPAMNELYFSDFRLREEATEEELAADLATKYGFTEINSVTPTYGGRWSVTSAGSVFAVSWDETENATKVNMSASGAAINGRYYVMYTAIDMLAEAQAAGFTTASFNVRSSDGAFTADGKGIRVYSKQNTGLDGAGIDTNAGAGIYVYGDFGTAADTTEFTVTIDIADFLALNANAGYVGIVLNMAGSTNAYFSDLQYSKVAEEEPEGPDVAEGLMEKYGFTQTNSTTPTYGGIWNVAASGIMGLGWDATENAMKVNMVNASAAINGRYYVMYTAIDMLTEAQTEGFTTVSFNVRSSDGAFNTDGKGIRVFSKQNAGLDGAGIETNAGAGIYVYGDFGTAVNTTEFRITIDVDEFLGLNANAAYIGFVVAIPANTSFYMSDLQFVKPTVEEPTVEEQLAETYGFTQANSATTANGGRWNVAANGIMGLGWDSTEGAMKVNMVNASAAINGRYYVMYTAIDILTAAQAEGFATVSFKVGSTDGAFTTNGKGIRVFSKQNSGLDGVGIDTNASAGIYVYGDFGTAANTTEFTITIDIEDFFALNANAAYIGFVVAIPANTSFYMSDLQFMTATEMELINTYGFTQTNSTTPTYGGIWNVAASGQFGLGWNATTETMRVNMVATGAEISGRYYVMYTSIDILKDAQTKGGVSVSFKVTSSDGAFTDAGRGLRVFSKQNAGLDGAAITINAEKGIYTYQDFGTELNTTEFTVTINIADFLALNADASYVGIVLNMAGGTTAHFSNMRFEIIESTLEQEEDYIPYTIVYADNASKVEKLAASELEKYLEEATGKEFYIAKESLAATDKKIFLGNTNAITQEGITLDEEALNGDGFILSANGGNLYIAGATGKGTLYGVYYYLEKYIGVRFYTLDCEEVPSVEDFSFPTEMETEIPAFRYRGVLSDATMHVNKQYGQTAGTVAEFYAKTRQSHEFLVAEAQSEVDKYFGGSVSVNKNINQAHNNLTYVPVADYYETNSKMFYTRSGATSPVDICYSNGINADGTIADGTNTASVYVANLKNYILANPSAQYHVLGQEDVTDHCGCSTCLTASWTYGYNYFSDAAYTAVVLRFYNAVANAIVAWEVEEGRTPVKLVCYSYLFTSEAPVKTQNSEYVCHDTVKLADNIILRFADFTSNQYYSLLDENQENGYGADYLEKWAAVIGDNDTWYWGYATNHSYYFAYTPSLQKVSTTLNGLKTFGTEYAFYQHSTSETFDWRAMMESYVISKMLWDPTQNVTALRDEYLAGYYGLAGDKVKAFVDNFDACMEQIATDVPLYYMYDIMGSNDENPSFKVEELVTKAFLESQLALLDEAVAIINASELSDEEKAVYLARIEAVRITPAFYLAYSAERYYDNDADIATARASFIYLCESVGVTAYGEHKYVSTLKTEWGLY